MSDLDEIDKFVTVDNETIELDSCEMCKRPNLGHRGGIDEDCEISDSEALDEDGIEGLVQEIKSRNDVKEKFEEIKNRRKLQLQCGKCEWKGRNQAALNIHVGKMHKKKKGSEKSTDSVEMMMLFFKESERV